MNFLIDSMCDIQQYNEILNRVRNNISPIAVTGIINSQKAQLAYSICKNTGYSSVYVAANEFEAKKIYEDFLTFFEKDVLFFPSKEIILYDVEARNNDMIFERASVLSKIQDGKFTIVILSIQSLLQKITANILFKQKSGCFKIGENVNISNLPKILISAGYEKVSIVENRGQFAIRGGIIDIFPVNLDNPIRIELFDDEVDSIRIFDVETQRSLEMLKEVKVVPCLDFIYEDKTLPGIIQRIQNDLDNIENKDISKDISQICNRDIEKLETRYYFPGMDRLIPYIIDKPSNILDYLSRDVIIFMDNVQKIQESAQALINDHYEVCKDLFDKGRILPKTFELHFDFENIQSLFKNRMVVFDDFLTKSIQFDIEESFNIKSKPISFYNRQLKLLIKDIKLWRDKRNKIIIFSSKQEKSSVLLSILKENDIFATKVEDYEKTIYPGDVFIINKNLHQGFEYQEAKFVVITDKEIFGEEKIRKFSYKHKSKKIELFTDLNVGDYVVHYSHGIGQYMGIEQLNVQKLKKDYLKIKYLSENYLYIPINQMDLIQKYIGSEGKTPKLSNLGGRDWSKAKLKVKESLMKLAKELVKIYAKREAQKKSPFLEDTVWQKQFEESFSYEETDDQLRAIEEMKKDMESDKPMDRLLCGDVGYGKTEVALRGIFKAVMSGKQVAYLAPTTVLAYQQYNNFKNRMDGFGVTVELISRLRTKAQQKVILKKLKSGSIDVLVGTHRLLQKDIQFKNLGFLVVDEEQRFGVLHKERIKTFAANIDVLTLTATPIPRTLHMSLSGIRDISTMENPPEGRYPVQTYVMEYDLEIIKNAILKELARGGQVFYLFNRVKDIHEKEFQLQMLVPDAKIVVAHGQMDQNDLEDIMSRFLNHEFNVLVCTTIIESGLDIPDANTIIIEDADKMGLAQLYQLRGRVGRSDKLAYAYITHKRSKSLSEIAQKRLQTIKEFTEFGSGFKIAMRDLQIRGAGNLLGKQQHGHMEAVGYDMYCRLLNEAIKEFKGDQPSESEIEVTIDLNIDAYIDNAYIEDEQQRLEIYKKISLVSDDEDIINLNDELLDRFGNIPSAVNNLIEIARIKSMAKQCKIKQIQQKGSFLVFQCYDASDSFKCYGSLVNKYQKTILTDSFNKNILKFKFKDQGQDNIILTVKSILKDILNLYLQC